MLTSLLKIQPAAIARSMVSRTMSVTTNVCRLKALCKANSAVLSQNVAVIDALVNRKHAAGANDVFQAECPITGTTVGKQFRHSLDHLEKVALDGLRTVRDNEKPADLHYDVRERGNLYERDVFEARERACFIQDVFDGVHAGCEKEGDEMSAWDGQTQLTAYFTLPAGLRDDVEIPLSTTLEREMAFGCHHAIHHNNLVRAIAAAGHTGLTLEDLPSDFGRWPAALVTDISDVAA